ncbi:MAG: hypothetical protein P8Y54_10000 [Xanthomonadales bacterium]
MKRLLQGCRGARVTGRVLRAGLVVLALGAGHARANPAVEPDSESATQAPTAQAPDPQAPDSQANAHIGSDAGAQEARDDCDRAAQDQEFQETAQDTLRSWSCHTFRWFDGWWGKEYDFPENEVNGWMIVGAEYRDYDGFDPRVRLKVRAPLPNLSRRWDVWLGRLDEEAYITDTDPRDNTFYNSGLVDRGQEDSWLLGLGHRRGRGRTGWDWSVGVRLRVPPEPYVKLSWLYRKQFTPDTDLRFRQTFFWRTDDGFGTTSRGDLTSRLGARDVLRWEGILRFTEETQGTDWYLGHTWYHLLPNGSALSLLTFADGETQRPVELKDAGFQLTWRRPFTRDWMYLSFGPSLTWPRRQPEDERKANLGFGVWIEMEFGDWRY